MEKLYCPRCGSQKYGRDWIVDGKVRLKCYVCGKKSFHFLETDPLGSVSSLREGAEAHMPSDENRGTVTFNSRITNVFELLRLYEVDLQEWEIEKQKLNKWEVGAKGADGSLIVEPLFQVVAYLRQRVMKPVKFAPIRPIEITLPKRDPLPPSGSAIQKTLLIPDSHHGYRKNPDGSETPLHDERATEIAVEIALRMQPDTIVIMGDQLDLAEWSTRYLITPDMRNTTQRAVNACARFFARLRYACPRAKMVMIVGNHEQRIEKALATNMSAAYGLKPADEPDGPPLMSLERLLGLKTLRIELSKGYPDGCYWVTPQLKAIHGELCQGHKTPKKVTEVYSDYSVVYGHLHQRHYYCRSVPTPSGSREVFAACPGCLCHIDGRVPSAVSGDLLNWQQGLIAVNYTEGYTSISHIPIQDGRAVYRDELICIPQATEPSYGANSL